VREEFTLNIGIQRDLRGACLGHPVEELQQLDAVRGQHCDPLAATNAELRQTGREGIGALIDVGVGEDSVVYCAADAIRRSGSAVAQHIYNYVTSHLKKL
jgi:hypothetical protein